MSSYPAADPTSKHDLLCLASIAAAFHNGDNGDGIAPAPLESIDVLASSLNESALPLPSGNLPLGLEKLMSFYTYPDAPKLPMPLSRSPKVWRLATRSLFDLATAFGALKKCIIAVKMPKVISPEDERNRRNSKSFLNFMNFLRANQLVAVLACDSAGRVGFVAPLDTDEYAASWYYVPSKEFIPWAKTSHLLEQEHCMENEPETWEPPTGEELDHDDDLEAGEIREVTPSSKRPPLRPIDQNHQQSNLPRAAKRVCRLDSVKAPPKQPMVAILETVAEDRPLLSDNDVASLSSRRPGETPDNANIVESDGRESNSDAEAATKNPFHSTKECRVLIAGCGNSRVGESMLSDGFAPSNITSVDFSSVVIQQMKEKYTSDWQEKLMFRLRQERKLGDEGTMKSPAKKCQTRSRPIGAKQHSKKKPDASPVEKMSFECMDLTKKLSFADESFDLIFCKGTLDAVLCCANTSERIQCMMGEVHRVLDSRHGVMVIISYGEPEHRLNLFDPSLWDVKHYSIPKPNVPGEKMGEDHYVYILFKKER